MPSLIDTMVAFISGGNLRMRHKWERWFFGILLIGAFFITSLFTGDLLDCIMTILNHKMKRLEQLADLPSPIYVHSTLVNDVEHIQNILRLVEHTHSKVNEFNKYLLKHYKYSSNFD